MIVILGLLARGLILRVWAGGLAWCWHLFISVILPVALDRCPWAEGCEGP